VSTINYKEAAMGSFNPNPGQGINPELKQQTIFQELNPGEKTVISRLINSIYYFIDCVFILKIKDKYRLVAQHNGVVLYDNYYTTEIGGKIAFDKIFKDKAWAEDIKAQWSHLYDPDIDWLEEKCKNLEW
jgi:hypothetical protein